MRELELISLETVTDEIRRVGLLLVCDETAITCEHMRHIQDTIAAACMPAVLAMPDTQYVQGLRGFAKAQILANVCGVSQVLALNLEEMTREIDQKWGETVVMGILTWQQAKRLVRQTETVEQVFPITLEQQDKHFMGWARALVGQSNCWQSPAACVYIKNGQPVATGVSTNLNGWDCKRQIPFQLTELPLNQGERLHFCDSQHAESTGVAQAARNGTDLEGSELILTRFPCRGCIKSVVQAGVVRLVFQQGSYGLADASLLMERGVDISRIIND